MIQWNLKKTATSVGFVLVVVFLLSHAVMLYQTDISLSPTAIQRNPNPVYLISYADGPTVFHKNQNTLAASAINKGVDFIFMYGRHHLPNEFLEKNKFILSHKQGAGFWLWKPWVILNTLEQAPENAIVIYLDSGFLISSHLQPLLESMGEKPMLFVKHDDLGTTIQSVTQKHTLTTMECTTESCLQGDHIWAAVNVYKNTPKTRAFVKRWLSWCQMPQVIMQTDLFNAADFPKDHLEKANGFVHHHHDEAILSVLCHQNPENLMILPLSQMNQMRILRWHHRHPSRESESLLPHMNKNTKFLQKKLYWAWTWPLEKIKAMGTK
jgi:hypothetical protein